MVVGGFGAQRDVEIVDLSEEGKTCRKPPKISLSHSSIGTFFNGQASVCGGSLSETDLCLQYDSKVRNFIDKIINKCIYL